MRTLPRRKWMKNYRKKSSAGQRKVPPGKGSCKIASEYGMLRSNVRKVHMKKNIVLIGMPGVGKSTIGVVLAKVMGYQFVDADLVIQEKEGKLLCEIIEEVGAEGFIEVENRINSSICVEHAIIATGGSVVYGAEAMAHLREIGTILYLKLPYEELERRLCDIKGRGVVLKEGQTLRDLYEERRPLYEKYADVIVEETRLNVEQTIEKILELKERFQ